MTCRVPSKLVAVLRRFDVKGASAIIISADSQSTGEDQSVFAAESNGGTISITELAILQGNALDIDQWHVDNFTVIA